MKRALVLLIALLVPACNAGSLLHRPHRPVPPPVVVAPPVVVVPPVVEPVTHLPALIARTSEFFGLANGERFSAIEATDFQLYQRFLNGEDITPVLRQRRDAGFNLLRVLGMCDFMFRLYPQEHPDFFAKIPVFMALVEQHGMYVEWTVFADATLVMPFPIDQVAHWQQFGAALIVSPARNSIIEAVNEEDQTVNRLAAIQELQPIDGVLSSHGSNGTEATPVRPWWGYEAWHTNEISYQYPRKVAHNGMEYSIGASNSDGSVAIVPSHRPVLLNENKRVPDRWSDPNAIHDAAKGAALLVAGAAFHSVHGKFSQLWEDVELELARIFASAMREVPLSCQDGGYRHRADLEQSDAAATGERVYQRGDDPACIVHIRP